jgi:hypothetical protein
LDIQKLKTITARSVSNAGPRYTPSNDPHAPNLPIEDLNLCVSGLTVDLGFKEAIQERLTYIEKRWQEAKEHIASPEAHTKLETITKGLQDLIKAPPIKGALYVRKTTQAIAGLSEIIQAERSKLETLLSEFRKQEAKESPEARFDSEKVRGLESKVNTLRNFDYSLNSCDNFLGSPPVKLRLSNSALLLGGWGTGKTHFLCDTALALLKRKHPAVVILARDISPLSSPEEVIAEILGEPTLATALRKLNELGKGVKKRALLIIDGINEGDFDTWKKAVTKISMEVSKNKYLGLLVSCRTPMNELIFNRILLKRFVTITHPGFSEIEFDAQKEFFKHYKLPLPEVPLLAEEFSRPLTLKIICQTLTHLSKKDQDKGFDGITSGQKGMTFILEHFIIERSKSVEEEFNLPKKFIWKIIKGDKKITDPLLAGFAPYLAETGRQDIPKNDAIKILLAMGAVKSSKEGALLLAKLEQEGIIYQHRQWHSSKNAVHLIGLPYQRFSDHIIARSLLDRYLKKGTLEEVKTSLEPSNPLGSVFRIRDGHFPYLRPDLAEAVIIEFPERTKNVLPEKNRELYFFLPKESQDLNAYKDPFIKGLNWRPVSSISKDTDRVVNCFLKSGNKYVYHEMLEALITSAAKPKHVYSGEVFFRYISKSKIADRDLSWTEFVRRSYEGCAIERILAFYTTFELSNISEETAKQTIPLISTFLTTTRKTIRDRATLALVKIGELHPKSLFGFVDEALRFNDPYVGERVLAAVYGVAMGKAWLSPSPISDLLKEMAKFLITEMFAESGRFRTTHSLIQGYALGLIELAQKSTNLRLSKHQKKLITAPYPGINSPFPEPSKVRSRTVEAAKQAMHMDFSNYTLGRLIRNRPNYDMKNNEYVRVRKQICWRIINLGYSFDRFKEVDSEIMRYDSYGRTNSDGSKIDRYGKKYSWIAYFEMFGLRHAHGLIDREPRPSDCDIDPSFPQLEETKATVKYAKVLEGRRTPSDHIKWLKSGPSPSYSDLHMLSLQDDWILVQGSVGEKDERKDHEIWAHIELFLLQKKDVARFKREFRKPGFPPHELTSTGESHYTFAGEIGWSSNYGDTNEELGQIHTFFKSQRTQYTTDLHRAWLNFDFELLVKYHRSRSEASRAKLKKRLDKHIEDTNSSFPEDDQLSLSYVISRQAIKDLVNGSREDWHWEEVGGIDVETLAWGFSWESYHSSLNQTTFTTLNPSICRKLGLKPCNRSIYLFDQAGKKATLYIDEKNSWHDGARLLYLRKDLLRDYLRNTDKVAVIASWGERQINHEHVHQVWDEIRKEEPLTHDDVVFKKLCFYDLS